MAEFRMISGLERGSRPIVVHDGRVAEMNKSGKKLFFFARAEIEVILDGASPRRLICEREIIEAADGCQVVPYFKDTSGWHVVMVEQFRIALPGKTLEPAGGEVDEKDPKASMARELQEEAHITVDANDIELVFCERIEPSMLGARMWSGIVEITRSQLPKELSGGEWANGEYTVLVVRSLLELLRERDAGRGDFCLRTSRALDELAKKVGLLTRNY